MKRLLLLILVLPFISFSQCPPNGSFNSQAEIDALAIDYPDCTILSGSLSISGDDISDLNGLAQIEQCESLSINNNLLLQSLDGLNPILLVGNDFAYSSGVYINNNASLTTISALYNIYLEYGAEGYVFIRDNPVLSSLNGLHFMSASSCCTGIQIVNNDLITNLVGLNDLRGGEYLAITDNDNLVDFMGLGNVIEYENLLIDNNLSLQSLNGANIDYCNNLESLTITNNPSLTDIDSGFGENNGVSQVNNLIIKDNINLSICNIQVVCHKLNASEDTSYSQVMDIHNNAPDCNSVFEVDYACNNSPFNDNCVFDFEFSSFPIWLTLGETIIANNEYATTSSETPSCNDVTERQDVWFVFDSGDNTTIDVITQAGYNLQLWEGICYDLTQVENACGSMFLTDIPVASNTNYIVQVWSDTNKRPAGWFNLTVQDGLLSTQDDVFIGLSLYPNPVNNSLHLKASNSISTVRIYNLLGQRVNEIYPNTMESQLNTENLQSGMYLVEVTIGNQKATYKIVK